MPILGGLPVLGRLFRGDGRLASSIGEVGNGTGPLPFPATATEDPTTRSTQVLIFLTPHLVSGGEE
ncbi:MAG: hypothetical protein A2Z12_07730 [Actinobacteria bacterium RBG_16_68_21]|nr:MAG: hypothetical protein A2Z12_07730 [Actinobacteria bacterium RBG_16_68_21]